MNTEVTMKFLNLSIFTNWFFFSELTISLGFIVSIEKDEAIIAISTVI